MHELPPPPLRLRVRSWMPFVASAAFVAFSIQVALNAPLAVAGLGLLAVLMFLPQLRARRRVRKLLLSGDIEAVLATWKVVLENVPHRETMAPLFTATALAANGMLERARAELARAAKGDAWDAAIEHRLFVETLLDAFEGQRLDAVAKAEKLSLLPLPPVGPFVKVRVASMRAAAGALARAFAHSPKQGDLGVLEAAARRNPIVHWAMRYAAAVACVDRGDHRGARRLLTGAPLWPEDSAFRDFHAELSERVDGPSVSAVR